MGFTQTGSRIISQGLSLAKISYLQKLKNQTSWEALYDAQTGVYSNVAAQFTAASSEYLSIAGNADVRGGVASWWRAGWVYLDSVGAARIIEDCLGSNNGHTIGINSSNQLYVTAGTGSGTQTATHGTALSASTWYFFYVEYDGTNLGVGLNNGALATQALGAAYSPGTNAFGVGSTLAGGDYMNGRMESVCGGDGTLSSGQITALYNNGDGIEYEDTTLGSELKFWWRLSEESGVRYDRHGTNHLTDNNSVTVAGGKVNGAARDGNHARQFTAASSEYFSHAGNADLRGGATWWRAGWVYLDSVGAARTLADCLGSNNGYTIGINSSNQVFVTAGEGSGTQTATNTTTTVPVESWVFWYVEFDGTNLLVRVNDASEATQALGAAYSAGTNAFRVGSTLVGGN